MSKEQKLALDAVLSQGGLDLQADVPTLRATFNELMARIPVPDDVQQSPTTIGGVGAIEVTVRGADADADGVILYFHGGVYVIGTAAATVPLVGDLARRTGTRAITLDYRLAPEHPYPAAVAARKTPTRAYSNKVLTRARSLLPASRPVVGWRWLPCSPSETPTSRCPPVRS